MKISHRAGVRSNVRHFVRTCLRLTALALAGFASGTPAVEAQPPAPIVVKVLVVNLFGLEAAPWLEALKPQIDVTVPGLAADYPLVRCTAEGVCQMTTAMGHANAAASIMAVIFCDRFDFRSTYFLVNGIAGINPLHGTIGTAAWARFVVDSGIAHEIDAREMPRDWRDGYFGIMTDAPGQKPRLDYLSEVFVLDAALLQRALALSSTVPLADSADVRAYRARYPMAPANQPPHVVQCDTVTSDTWWAGQRLGDRTQRWVSLLTDGQGRYCTTQQEDNAVLTALARGARERRLDMKRIAVLRAGSDFDRPFPRQSVIQSMRAQRQLPGAARIAADNLVRAGMPLVTDIINRWEEWKVAVPAP